LEIPGFVECCVVGGLDHAGVEIDVLDVLVCSRVSEEDAAEVIVVQFSPSFPGAFNTYSRAKHFEARQVRFVAVISFEGSAPSFGVDESVVEVHAV
jgi:predicted permease